MINSFNIEISPLQINIAFKVQARDCHFAALLAMTGAGNGLLYDKILCQMHTWGIQMQACGARGGV